MFKKPALLAAFGIGYVLGARAGRERYDAMVAKAQELWHDPRVQEKAHNARVVAGEKADAARHAVQDKMPGDSTPSSASAPTSQTTPSAPRPHDTVDPVADVPRGWES
ncbi:hypothetical protein ACFU7D_06170 [Nocardioides sp. NPDC057577]|uniref:hypothetical protein n=1 Tax=Nocardioides sp. NPDC057577 TaxID=3346171 RepID=UPI00366B89A9